MGHRIDGDDRAEIDGWRRSGASVTERTRRATLALLGASLAGVAGCNGRGDGEPDTASSTPTATRTPTATATATPTATPTDRFAQPEIPAAYQFRRWLPALWTRPYAEPTRVGYQLVNPADLSFARLRASRGNQAVANSAYNARSEEGIPLAMRYQTDRLEAVVIARGPTTALLDSLEQRGFSRVMTRQGYDVYRADDEDGVPRTVYLGGEDWSIYVRGTESVETDLYPDLLATWAGESPTWATASPETRRVFARTYTAADSQAVLFPPSAPGGFDGVGGNMLAGVASTSFPNGDDGDFDTARLQVTLAFTQETSVPLRLVRAVYAGDVDSESRRSLRLSYWPRLTDPTVDHLGDENVVVVAQDVATDRLRRAQSE